MVLTKTRSLVGGLVSIVLMGSFALAAGAAAGTGSRTAAAAHVATVALPGPLVTPEWLAEHLQAPGLRLVDLRTEPGAFQNAHLPGATLVRVPDDLIDATNPVEGMALTQHQFEQFLTRLGIARTDAVVLYDDIRNLWAARAYWVFKLYGHPQVALLDGGLTLWQRRGRTVERGPATVTAGTKTATAGGATAGAGRAPYRASPADPSLVATWQEVKGAIGEGSFCDVRSPKEFAGLDVRAARGGHLPEAVNVEWTLATRPDGTFRPADELRTLYRQAGLAPQPGRDVIVYCQTGVRAAHTWFVLKELLGYPRVRVYDGSWAEWGNRADLPIER